MLKITKKRSEKNKLYLTNVFIGILAIRKIKRKQNGIRETLSCTYLM